MGQLSCRCKKANNDFGSVHVYHHGAPPQFTNLVEAYKRPDGVGEDDVGGEKSKRRKEANCKKKRRFKLCRWFSCWRAGEKNCRKSQADGETQGTGATTAQPEVEPSSSLDHGSKQQVIYTVENLNLQETPSSDPGVIPTVKKHLTVHPDVLHSPVDWSFDIGQTPVLSPDCSSYHTSSEWSIDSGLTPACTMSRWSNGVTKTSAHTMSDWSIDVIRTPACTTSDWSTDATNTPVRTVSDWSIDVTQPPFHTSTPNCCIDATPIPVLNEWSGNFSQTSEQTTSNWSINVGQTPVCTEASVSGQMENNGKMKTQGTFTVPLTHHTHFCKTISSHFDVFICDPGPMHKIYFWQLYGSKL